MREQGKERKGEVEGEASRREEGVEGRGGV